MDKLQTKRYRAMVRKGVSPLMAEMLTLQQAPGSRTDKEFFNGRGTLASQFDGDEKVLAKVVQNAKSRGFVPGVNDVYVPSMADGVGDPAAFVPATGGRNHVRRVCEQRGWSCDGDVKLKGRDAGEPVNVPLAADLVAEGAYNATLQNPDMTHKQKSELAEKISHEHRREKE